MFFCASAQAETLTWTLLDTEGSISVLGPGIVFQLEGSRIVNKWLRALGNTCPTVVEVGTGLQTQENNLAFFFFTQTFVSFQ